MNQVRANIEALAPDMDDIRRRAGALAPDMSELRRRAHKVEEQVLGRDLADTKISKYQSSLAELYNPGENSGDLHLDADGMSDLDPDEYLFGEINPYSIHEKPITGSVYEFTKTALFTILLIPLWRFLLVIAWVIIAIATILLSVLGSEQKAAVREMPDPLPKWRFRILQLTQYIARCIAFFFGFHHIQVVGKPDPKARIFVGNHRNFMDVFLILGNVTCMAVSAAENLHIPMVGHFLRATSSICLDRADPNAKKHSAEMIKKMCAIGKYPPLLVFPEGTCTNGSCLLQFKAGAFLPGLPVQPFLVTYDNKFSDLGWTVGSSLPWMIYRSMTQFHNYCKIEFLPVYYPDEAEQEDPKLYAENVRRVMARAIDVKLSSYSVDDTLLLMYAHSKAKNVRLNLRFSEVSDRFSTKEIKELLQKFVALDRNKDGKIDFREFCDVFKLDAKDPYSRAMFEAFDRNNQGYLDFRSFVLGLYFFHPAASPKDRVRFVFEMYDVKGDRMITFEEANQLVHRNEKVSSQKEIVGALDILFKDKKALTLNEFVTAICSREDLLNLVPTTLEGVMAPLTSE
eukprot:Clim_evm28s146 gene=Clim_evmTU28s146